MNYTQEGPRFHAACENPMPEDVSEADVVMASKYRVTLAGCFECIEIIIS